MEVKESKILATFIFTKWQPIFDFQIQSLGQFFNFLFVLFETRQLFVLFYEKAKIPFRGMKLFSFLEMKMCENIGIFFFALWKIDLRLEKLR